MDDANELSAWLDAMSAVLNLPIAEAYRPGVLTNLAVIARQTTLLDGFVLDDREEPAATFRA